MNHRFQMIRLRKKIDQYEPIDLIISEPCEIPRERGRIAGDDGDARRGQADELRDHFLAES